MKWVYCFFILFFNTFIYSEESLISPPPVSGVTPIDTIKAANHIRYLMHAGNTEQALKEYEEYRQLLGSHDFELIEQIGLILLDQGFRSRDNEIQRLTLFGAGISLNEKTLYIIEDGLLNGEPEQELIALNFLARFQNDRADQILRRAMTSNMLIVRLEAGYQLAAKKDPKVVGQIEGLMAKVPQVIWPIFPQLFAMSGTPEAKKILRKLLTHKNESIRVACVISLAKYSHDDLLPTIRRLASHQEVVQQEACAAALGVLGDESSSGKLIHLSHSPNIHVRLAALGSLYKLGRQETRLEVQNIAKTEDLFAISLLGKMPGSANTLADLLKSDQLIVRLNAAIALLELGDQRCVDTLATFLVRDVRDLALAKTSSPGKSLSIWKIIPSARQNFEDDPVSLEVSLNLKEEIVLKSIELPETQFLLLANAILELQQNDLVPVLVQVLENHPTPNVIALLKKHQQKVGAPLIRNYCNLALCRLKEQGPYADNLREWVTQQRNIDLIQFRPVIPLELRENPNGDFELEAHDTSRLLVESFESFVSMQDDKGIDMLISVIQNGNAKNKYALVGLLMRAIQ